MVSNKAARHSIIESKPSPSPAPSPSSSALKEKVNILKFRQGITIITNLIFIVLSLLLRLFSKEVAIVNSIHKTMATTLFCIKR